MSQISPGTSSAISREELATIASRQKVIIVCILIYLLAVVAQFVVPAGLLGAVRVTALVVVIVATVCVFMLATRLYGMGLGILLGILTLIPLIGLIVLLIVNAKATRILKDNGVTVGLLGAKGG